MSVGRIVSSSAAVLAVAGCTALAIGMARAEENPTANSSPTPTAATRTERPAYLPDTTEYGYAGGVAASLPAATAPPTPAAAHPATSRSTQPTRTTRTTTHPAAPKTSPHTSAPAPVVHATPPPAPVTHPAAPAPVRGQSLPLSFGTGDATRVITVTAGWAGSTTATLQAWTKAPGGGWLRYGSAVTAHIGSAGMTTHPSEEVSATPIGSFTLTQAFGYYGNPGTSLPYFRTNPDDYWISDKGSPYYNTHQRCGSCGYNDGINERLYYETPYYNYAVVIDANTRNAPGGVQYDHGSAFFLHVTDGGPTAGCVAIPQSTLVPLMRWLTPGAHPRILIGVV